MICSVVQYSSLGFFFLILFLIAFRASAAGLPCIDGVVSVGAEDEGGKMAESRYCSDSASHEPWLAKSGGPEYVATLCWKPSGESIVGKRNGCGDDAGVAPK